MKRQLVALISLTLIPRLCMGSMSESARRVSTNSLQALIVRDHFHSSEVLLADHWRRTEY